VGQHRDDRTRYREQGGEAQEQAQHHDSESVGVFQLDFDFSFVGRHRLVLLFVVSFVPHEYLRMFPLHVKYL
jgi:hypothetical protein